MKLYKINVKDIVPDNYCGFMVAGNSIPDALETIYKYVCLDKDGKLKRDIPYVLRSSNMDICCLGDFTPDKALDSKISKVLMTDYYNA